MEKKCNNCKKTHDLESWLKLKYVGVQKTRSGALELRDCTCNSTLGLPIEDKRLNNQREARMVRLLGKTAKALDGLIGCWHPEGKDCRCHRQARAALEAVQEAGFAEVRQ